MRTTPVAALIFGLLVASSITAGAQSGTRVTPDGQRALISKDIAGQRWAISRNPDRTVTGNVFIPGGGPPQFVFCTQTGSTSTDVTLSCSGADACPLAICEADEWLFIADVTLPLSFFGVASGSAAGTSADASGVAPSAAKMFATPGRTAGVSASQASGIQITPQGGIPLISKDIGDQRWAIARNGDGTVTGNVFFPGGGEPQFVWCEPTGTASDPIALRCLGASACVAAGEGGCPSTDWTLIAEVSLPASFFRARETVSLDALADELAVRFGEDAAFRGLALALDRGYSLRQIARATLSDRLLTSGEIVERAGGPETSAEAPFGVFAENASSTTSRPAAERTYTVAELNAKLQERTGKRLLSLLLLAEQGYPIDQLIEELLVNDATVDLNAAELRLRGRNGGTIPPRKPPAGVGSPPVAAKCGNGRREIGEGCDGSDFGTASCDTLQLPSGTISCKNDCTLDASGCRGTCGDGRQYGSEQCDGSDLAGESCSSLGFGTGLLSCTSTCAFDSTRCEVACPLGGGPCCGPGTKPCNGICVPNDVICCALGTLPCGNGCIPSEADCCGGNGLYCEVGRVCVGNDSCCPAGQPQVCGNQCVAAGSSCCGNGTIEAGEECDGADVGGASCPELGSIRCTSSCKLDTSGCESKCPTGAFTCGTSCAPNGSECCDGTSVFCDGGDTCAFGGGGGAICCPAGFPTFCAGTCYPSGVVCCGSYACAAGSTCLGNNQCG